MGLAAFSRVLSWLLAKYHSQTIAVLIGFLVGSLFVIWPFQHREYVHQVRDTQVVEWSNPKVQQLLEHPPNTNLPEYERLGKVQNKEAALDDMKQVEIETVKNKLIASEPFIPGWLGARKNDHPDVWGGLLGLFAGMILVGGLDRLRKA